MGTIKGLLRCSTYLIILENKNAPPTSMQALLTKFDITPTGFIRLSAIPPTLEPPHAGKTTKQRKIRFKNLNLFIAFIHQK